MLVNASRLAILRELVPYSRVAGIVADAVVRLTYVRLCNEQVAYCRWVDDAGTEDHGFIAGSALDQITVVESGGARVWVYPTGVPFLFESLDVLTPVLGKARRGNRLHDVVQAYIAEVASRLTGTMATVKEIHAVAGARNDALSVEPLREILWEVFGTEDRVEADLRKLERDAQPNRLKVAVVLDPEVDSRLFEKFTRARQGSSVTWLRVSDLLLADRFQNTVMTMDRALDGLSVGRWADQLALVSFGLAPGLTRWTQQEDLVLSYWGLANHAVGVPMEDPVLHITVQNVGTREARISSAYVNVRFRHTVLHGLPNDQRLKPAAEVSLPLNNGEEGYRTQELVEPVVVKPGEHALIQVRLNDAGSSWSGMIELGLRYGERKVVQVPALGIML